MGNQPSACSGESGRSDHEWDEGEEVSNSFCTPSRSFPVGLVRRRSGSAPGQARKRSPSFCTASGDATEIAVSISGCRDWNARDFSPLPNCNAQEQTSHVSSSPFPRELSNKHRGLGTGAPARRCYGASTECRQCRETEASQRRRDDDEAFFSPSSSPRSKRRFQSPPERESSTRRELDAARRRSHGTNGFDERWNERERAAAVSSTWRAAEDLADARSLEDCLQRQERPRVHTDGSRKKNDAEGHHGCHSHAELGRAQTAYGDEPPLGYGLRKRTRQMREEEERNQQLKRRLCEVEDDQNRAGGADEAWREHCGSSRRNAAESPHDEGGLRREQSQSWPHRDCARENDQSERGPSHSSHASQDFSSGSGRDVAEEAEEKRRGYEGRGGTWIPYTPIDDRRGSHPRGDCSRARSFHNLSPEKATRDFARGKEAAQLGPDDGGLEAPSSQHALRPSPRVRECGLPEDETHAVSPHSLRFRARRGHGSVDWASTEMWMRGDASRSEHGSPCRDSCAQQTSRSLVGGHASSLYAHVRHKVPSHRVPSSAGRRTTSESGVRRVGGFFSCFEGSPSDNAHARGERDAVAGEETPQGRVVDRRSLEADGLLEVKNMNEVADKPAGAGGGTLDAWTERLEEALQQLMTQQRMARLAQNTWKLHGKEISLLNARALCLCEEMFSGHKGTLDAFFSGRDAAWLVTASQFAEEQAGAGREYERLKNSVLRCAHCRVSVHALCGAVATMFPRRRHRFYCCVCRLLLFDPSSEVTWCSSITSLACPPHHASGEDPDAPPALAPSAAGRCVLPFSYSPVLQRELAASPAAALELRFFPMDDPTCGRHRPYLPDRLQIFFNPPIRALGSAGTETWALSRRRGYRPETEEERTKRDAFVSYSFAEAARGTGRSGPAAPAHRMSPRRNREESEATRSSAAGFDCSIPDFQAIYDPVVPHLHPKPPLYLADIKRHAKPKNGMNYVVARGQHREGRLFLAQLVCSLPVEESQLLEAIVQRRSLPIPYCTDFLKWLVAQQARCPSTSSDIVEVFNESQRAVRVFEERKAGTSDGRGIRRSSASLTATRGTRDSHGSTDVQSEDFGEDGLACNTESSEPQPKRSFWSAIIERLPGFKRRKKEPSPQVNTTSASAPASSPVLTLSLFSDDIAGRLRTPVRSVHCRHPECFDLQFYVRTNYLRHCGKSSWKCPLCEEYAFPHELYVDTLVQEILHMTNFAPPKRKAKTVSFHSLGLEKYVISQYVEDEFEDLSAELSGW
ncbi:MIZ/SP-RING zinc finger domain-containing protein [Besnoitia besnoiti]|uniref:MIZ/SP-RING zinc finger domain-containing protein n=1 Tax=Besnoitia besnoiti TaxID=94643 RepID=A0A2A9M4Q3_BESBE|nr:MIZ/SP-RING zinc finger domain-containing protein [Besnoitia besnoiti]PFH32929.1 MIZ/SP-RING zinc finger domain-containing protein [Besnoitia besnoiti]